MNPNIKIQRVQHILRHTGLLRLVEKIRYICSVLRYAIENRKFKLNNPGYKVPPQSLAYDAYSAPDYNFYKISGEKTAEALFEIVSHYLQNGVIDTLEWGCGPARVVRHIPHSFGARLNKVWGTDYNPESIKWCKKNVLGVSLSQVSLREIF